jgi:hypothetical protein
LKKLGLLKSCFPLGAVIRFSRSQGDRLAGIQRDHLIQSGDFKNLAIMVAEPITNDILVVSPGVDQQSDQHADAKAVHICQPGKVENNRPEITLNSLLERIPGKRGDFAFDIDDIGKWTGLADFGGEFFSDMATSWNRITILIQASVDRISLTL